jgi:hypothetical protein
MIFFLTMKLLVRITFLSCILLKLIFDPSLLSKR